MRLITHIVLGCKYGKIQNVQHDNDLISTSTRPRVLNAEVIWTIKFYKT